ncbi:MAG: EAL domain-containing protein [Lachnospiraceae bacterium]|nr:EAL domain-containing protein [Lachnospiraceae bacterium]
MISNKRVIGVCLTKINDRIHAEYVDRLRVVATEYNYKIIVFNSVVDFYNNDAYDEGAQSVYNLINYELLDVLVIFPDNFFNKGIVNSIIKKAKEYDVPVVLMDDTAEGCYSIMRDYKDAYKSVITHVIKDHGATDTYFIAGRKENDEFSEKRLACYREVLEENGLPFSEEQVGYGEYWNIPTQAVVDKLLAGGKKLPQAIICANDFMAIDVCERLTECGYQVPQDVIVTGFDGVQDADYFNPRLTTCKEDEEKCAEITIDVINKILDEKIPYTIFKEEFVAQISESCGCGNGKKMYYDNVRPLFHMMNEMESHETSMYAWIDRVLENADANRLSGMFARRLLPGSYICFKNAFVEAIIDNKELRSLEGMKDEYVAFTSHHNADYNGGMRKAYDIADMVPNLKEWAEDDSIYILTAVFIKNVAGGYYAASVRDVLGNAHLINRLAKSINIIINVIWSDYYQKQLKKSIANAALIDSVTGLPNLKGATAWFEKFSAVPENHDKKIVFSVYGFAKYKYIYENYGVKDMEEDVCKVAKLLQIANSKDSYVAHITEDSFLIINYMEPEVPESSVIDAATTSFYGNIEKYNSGNGKEYYVEVNAGCTVAMPGWEGSLSGFIKLANNEMYINRVKQGIGPVVKEDNKHEDFYTAFNILIEKNLFNYHFQPIVDARTGEIYAYEALMRTDASIGMNPLQVLETAGAYKRLYEVEKATMFNVMERFAKDFEQFGGRKVFINSIPGYVLTETDNKLLSDKFSEYMDYFVFEITEQNAVSDEELHALKHIRSNGESNEIAIDDYGTGHSNIVNLLRYAPQIIKIDRFLITDIYKDVNKQMFVKSTIDFARMNNIKVLAEGVENADELRAVIDFGVDYVQGYYTGRPAPEPIPSIAEAVKSEIQSANPYFAKVQ